jgi:tyrosinase
MTGDMATFMSPLDPIFWAHHCRVDELLVEWSLLGNQAFTNTTDWLNTTFTDFVDRKGNPVTNYVIGTILMPLYSYQYDTQCSC